MYQVKVLDFAGPMEKLLELIEAKKLDITRISLAEVTADFLKYIHSLTKTDKTQTGAEDFSVSQRSVGVSPRLVGVSPRVLADFLVVASQLILIKSKAILPDVELSEEEEESIQDLERRLELYQKVRPMFFRMKQFWSEGGQSFSREMLSSVSPVFYPSQNASTGKLHSALKSILDSLGSFFLETEKIERQLFTLEEKIKELFDKISNGISRFSQAVGKKSKGEVVVMFLALLHLLCDRVLKVKQVSVFEEIEIERISRK